MSADVEIVRSAFIADLDMVIDNLSRLHAKALEDCVERGGGWTPEQTARWEGGFRMLLGVLMDELRPMRGAWTDGGQFSRKGEEIMACLNGAICDSLPPVTGRESDACEAQWQPHDAPPWGQR